MLTLVGLCGLHIIVELGFWLIMESVAWEILTRWISRTPVRERAEIACYGPGK
jgi:hypothetical protein